MAKRKTPIHVVLRRRADELGLEYGELADRADVIRQIIEDIMNSDDELYTIWSVGEIKRVLDVLELNFTELFGLKCVFCNNDDERWRELAALPRNEVIKKRREQLGLSREDLFTKLGWTQWFVEYGGPEYGHQEWAEGIMRKYRAIEDAPDSIDGLVLEEVKDVAKGLGIPVQLLLGVKCSRCGT